MKLQDLGVVLLPNIPEVIKCAKGLEVVPHHSFSTYPPLDYLLVPGGYGTHNEVNNTVLIDFVKRQCTQCQAVLSVCTGAFIMHRAGLLSGLHATTHWNSLERLRAFKDVKVVEELTVQDGKIWTRLLGYLRALTSLLRLLRPQQALKRLSTFENGQNIIRLNAHNVQIYRE